MEDLDVCAGESPRFAVVVEGKPVPDILWFKVGFWLFVSFFIFNDKYSIIFKIVRVNLKKKTNKQTPTKVCALCFQSDILLAESSHYTFVYDDNECSLVVLNASSGDSGVYTCTARNLAGSVSCKAELTVHEGKKFLKRRMLKLFTLFYCKHDHLLQL